MRAQFVIPVLASILILGLIGFSQDVEAASMTFTTDTTITSDAIIFDGETWTVNSGVTLTIDAGVTINIFGGTINNNGNINNQGTITNSAGFINNNSGGIITNARTITNSRFINNNSGGTIINLNTIINNAGSIINNSGTIITFALITNTGAISNLGEIINCGGYTGTLPTGNILLPCIITQNITFTSNVTIPSVTSMTRNSGVVVTINPGVTLTVVSTINNSGTIENNFFIKIQIGGTFNNNFDGNLHNNNGAVIENNKNLNNNLGGIITNDAGGLIRNNSIIDNKIGSNLNNNGEIDNNGTITNSGTTSNLGNINNNCGAFFNNLGNFVGNPVRNNVPPSFGGWVISVNCTLGLSATSTGNVLVRQNSVLTIPPGLSLDIDFTQFNLTVESGSGVLIEAGGKIT